MILTKEQDKLITRIYLRNGDRYNIHKASEECQELGLVLNQYLLKPHKVDKQEIIDEIGDVEIRMEILKKIYPIDLIKKRIAYKLSKFETYIDHDIYNQI